MRSSGDREIRRVRSRRQRDAAHLIAVKLLARRVATFTGTPIESRVAKENPMRITTSLTLRIAAFVLATLGATGVLVAAGLNEPAAAAQRDCAADCSVRATT